MNIFSPKQEDLESEEYQLSGNNSDNSKTDSNEAVDLDTGWMQSNESQDFNDYTEEY